MGKVAPSPTFFLRGGGKCVTSDPETTGGICEWAQRIEVRMERDWRDCSGGWNRLGPPLEP